MGFIEQVQGRLAHAQDFNEYKRLWPSYKLVDELGIARPKVYITIPKAEVNTLNWTQLRNRLPNLFVVRPSVFVNPIHDFMLRDDGHRGLMNFSVSNMQTPANMLKDQAGYLNSIQDADIATMFEEFPLTYEDRLGYPIHYRVHIFGGVIGCVQGNATNANFWVDTDCKLLASSNNNDVSSLIPNVGIMDDLCAASKSISLASKLPYLRIDFVS